ncbi:hypothetical protein DNU06_08330 [Putridiphycobacter roseus]|uniref:Spore coat protein n=1 Tax=Putridiphycobacter roseus TaxID=2219161 RepID=A0A2W1N2Q7_9FLAO|nr:CotH kinase family protein [Putridiphycobacter roseus]PZE17271.1 hypothetical protein DNU06_08330 [Putridiphycobacter roseus]
MKTFGSIFLFTLLLISCKKNQPFSSLDIQTENMIDFDQKNKANIAYNEGEIKVQLLGDFKVNKKDSKSTYTVELNQPFPLGGLQMDDDWVLKGNNNDPSFVREFISYALFRQMSKENIAPACTYTNLYVNHEYQGLYLLLQKINAGFLDLKKSDSLSMLFKNPPFFSMESTSIKNEFNQKFPKVKKKNLNPYLKNIQQNILTYSKDSLSLLVRNNFDLENIMDWHLLVMFTENKKGYTDHFYLYKEKSGKPFKIALWDFDKTFDNGKNHKLISASNWEKNILLKRLYAEDILDYKSKLKARWKELSGQDIFQVEAIQNLMEPILLKLTPQIEKNNSHWHLTDYILQEEIEKIKLSIERRRNEMNIFFK